MRTEPKGGMYAVEEVEGLILMDVGVVDLVAIVWKYFETVKEVHCLVQRRDPLLHGALLRHQHCPRTSVVVVMST